MKSNAERMSLVFARAKKIKYCRGDKKLNFCKAATALLSVLLLCCTALFPTSLQKCGGCRLLRCNSADRRNGRICADSSCNFHNRNGDYRNVYQNKKQEGQKMSKNSVGDIITLHHSLRAADEYSCGRAKRNTYL